MAFSSAELSIAIDAATNVTGRLIAPPQPDACYVMAHGAGAGMTHPFMDAVAKGLAARGVATLLFNFPAMERGARRPDRPAVAQATVRAAAAEAARRFAELPLFAGGKSFGGRMTSQAQATCPLAGVRGLVFFGFPLHPAGKPGDARAEHLAAVACPMLFLQGSRDTLADPELLRTVIQRVGTRATLHMLDGADHGFHGRGRSGRTDAETLSGALDCAAGWMAASLAL